MVGRSHPRNGACRQAGLLHEEGVPAGSLILGMEPVCVGMSVENDPPASLFLMSAFTFLISLCSWSLVFFCL